ncbi:hypothetical protein Q9Q75_25700 [Mycobacterium intracellulare]|uniref:hypothetical protein n=1 Tax=Mycobacterium intracellulare TaxID=1767 RepID=UPI00334A622F
MTYDERLLKADHVNLQDGITYDVDGIPSFVGDDTKIPLKPFNPVQEPDEYDISLQLPDVGDNQETIDFWRNAQRRAPKAD